MENNKKINKVLGYYINKPVYRVKSQYNDGYYIKFDSNNYTLAPWKQNDKPSLFDAIECIIYKLSQNTPLHELSDIKKGLIKKNENNNIDSEEKITKYKNKLRQENEELDDIEEQIKKLKLKRQTKLNKIKIIQNKIIKLKPMKHKMDLQLLPTDIIKNISRHLIKNDDFRLNEIMHCKIDIGLTNFFFPGNLQVNKYLSSFLGPNKETQFYNYKNYEGLVQYKNILNMRYGLRESEDVVSYFKINFTFHGWKEFDERDKYREMFEARYTQPSYDIYI
jgi:hypothetical protein